MLTRARTALKFFTWGLAVGLLCAPRSGAETRARLRRFVLRQPSETDE
jgi:hypothetical protein